MSTGAKRFPLFFGSTVVLGCFLGMMGSIGMMLFTSLGIMVKPLGDAFGWARDEIAIGASIIAAGIIVGLLISGRLIDRYGARRVLLGSVSLSIVVVVAGTLLLDSLAGFYLMLVLAAVIGGPTNTVGYTRVIASWFDRRRGLFIGINACAIGLGYTLAPLVTDQAVRLGNWQYGYFALTAVMLFLVLPAIYFLIIDRPGDVGLEIDGQGSARELSPGQSAAHALDLRQAMATRSFWLLIYIAAGVAFGLQGALVHLVPLLTDRGMDSAMAALVASTVGLSVGAARLIMGFLLDHVFAPRLAMVVFSLAGLSLVLLLYSDYLPLYFVAAACIGFGIGAEGDLIAYLVSRYFGMRHFAQIFSVVFSSYIFGTGVGPAVFGWFYEHDGNYEQVQYLSLGILLSAILLLLFLAPYDRYLGRAQGQKI